MDRQMRFHLRLLLIINGFAQNVENTSQGLFANRNADRRASCYCFHASHKSVCASHGDAADSIVTQMLRYLSSQCGPILCFDADRLIDLRQLALAELNIQNGTDDLRHLAYILFCHVVSPLLITVQNLPSYLFFPISVPNLYTSSHKCLSKTFMPL